MTRLTKQEKSCTNKTVTNIIRKEMKMKQKKTVIINDISGFGRCSVTVALPIISKLKVQIGRASGRERV